VNSTATLVLDGDQLMLVCDDEGRLAWTPELERFFRAASQFPELKDTLDELRRDTHLMPLVENHNPENMRIVRQ
jgi:hypothetical protein